MLTWRVDIVSQCHMRRIHRSPSSYPSAIVRIVYRLLAYEHALILFGFIDVLFFHCFMYKLYINIYINSALWLPEHGRCITVDASPVLFLHSPCRWPQTEPDAGAVFHFCEQHQGARVVTLIATRPGEREQTLSFRSKRPHHRLHVGIQVIVWSWNQSQSSVICLSVCLAHWGFICWSVFLASPCSTRVPFPPSEVRGETCWNSNSVLYQVFPKHLINKQQKHCVRESLGLLHSESFGRRRIFPERPKL